MPGNQTVKGETLLKYFRYCLTPSGGGAQKQGELLCVLFSQYINKTYLASGRDLFLADNRLFGHRHINSRFLAM